ncbi:hypothetical protein [Portibacter lacus]|uniref:Uncharacterized protein n=1 Tax=Portibacter lacus TaxID=1099794 RepID=A0AA37SSI8_9BACT|nr:hypothetical protein [Portibacter lacus]GLR19192.1 hypothetical protein GCM10007940_38080 [Portibacter lacus]
MIRLLLILLLFSCDSGNVKEEKVNNELFQGTKDHITVHISSRVDTTNNDVKEVLDLYENYINSQSDSIYDNPYWNSEEKAQFEDFDFSRISIYNGISSSQLFRIYTPFVLSIEPKNEKYQIRVLYSNSAIEPPYVGSKVWCIHKLNALREEGNWKLENLLVEKTRKWQKKQVGFIEYVYSDEHDFDELQAKKAVNFCNKIIQRFNPNFHSKFRFYLANDIDEMGELENFDYYFTGITTGKAREGMILSSKGDEFYPHEFIHKLLPTNKNRGHVIEEGLATFLGTKENLEEYLVIMKKLAHDYNINETFSLKNILNNQTDWNGYPAAYPGGALICEVIFEIKGDEGIRELINNKTNNYDEIIKLSMSILNLEEDKVIRLIDNKIKEYK